MSPNLSFNLPNNIFLDSKIIFSLIQIALLNYIYKKKAERIFSTFYFHRNYFNIH